MYIHRWFDDFVAMITQIWDIPELSFSDIGRTYINYLDFVLIVYPHRCCQQIIRFENGQFKNCVKCISMVTLMLLSNRQQTEHYVCYMLKIKCLSSSLN